MQALYQLSATGAQQQNQQIPIGLSNSLLYQQLAAHQQIAAQQHQQQLAVSAGKNFRFEVYLKNFLEASKCCNH